MQEKKYNQLKEAIQKANPEIMELKFGCEVEIPIKHCVNRKSCGIYMRKHLVLRSDIPQSNCLVNRIGYKTNKRLKVSQDWIILGRPIILADVLLAMDNKGYGITVNGYGNVRISDIKFDWNLKDNNLDHQSEPTKELLHSLLVKK